MGRGRITGGGRYRNAKSEMDGAAVHCQSRFFKAFGKSGMGVAGARDILTAGAKGHGGGRFRNQITRPGTDDMNAENPVGFFVSQNLNLALDLRESLRTAICPEWE